MQLNGFQLRSDKCRLLGSLPKKNIGLLDPVAPLNMLGHGLLDLASRGVPFYVEHPIVRKSNIKLLLDRPTAIVKGGWLAKSTSSSMSRGGGRCDRPVAVVIPAAVAIAVAVAVAFTAVFGLLFCLHSGGGHSCGCSGAGRGPGCYGGFCDPLVVVFEVVLFKQGRN